MDQLWRRACALAIPVSAIVLACGGGDDAPDIISLTGDGINEEYCADTDDWDSSWATLEQEMVVLVNAQRGQTTTCGDETFDPAEGLVAEERLTCAARKHSKDMVDRDYFDHTNPDGESPFDRMENAGYAYSFAGENIAAGNATAADTLQQWVESPGHCKNLMHPDFTHIGIGYHPGGDWGHMWTQVFGRSR